MEWIKPSLIGLLALLFPGISFWVMVVKNPDSIVYAQINDIYFLGFYMGALGLLAGFGVFLKAAGFDIKFIKPPANCENSGRRFNPRKRVFFYLNIFPNSLNSVSIRMNLSGESFLNSRSETTIIRGNVGQG